MLRPDPTTLSEKLGQKLPHCIGHFEMGVMGRKSNYAISIRNSNTDLIFFLKIIITIIHITHALFVSPPEARPRLLAWLAYRERDYLLYNIWRIFITTTTISIIIMIII